MTRLRSDTARTRDRLLDAAGELLAERGLGFSLPDLARTSGVATATVYRHFGDVLDVYREFYLRLVGQLVAEIEKVPASRPAQRRFELIGAAWVALVIRWGRAATQIRSPKGFLERVQAGDPPETALHASLAPVVEALIADSVIPAQDTDYAVLVWITMFDERVVADLHAALGWPPAKIARKLSASVLGAWRAALTG